MDRRPVSRSIAHVGLALTIAFGVLAGGAGYWQVFRSADLSNAADNPAVIAAARNVVRGRILDRDGKVLATTKRDGNGDPYRVYPERSVSACGSLGSVSNFLSRFRIGSGSVTPISCAA